MEWPRNSALESRELTKDAVTVNDASSPHLIPGDAGEFSPAVADGASESACVCVCKDAMDVSVLLLAAATTAAADEEG